MFGSPWITSQAEDFSMTTVSSCGAKLQYVLSGLKRQAKTLGIHMRFYLRSSLSFAFFLSTWGVIFRA